MIYSTIALLLISSGVSNSDIIQDLSSNSVTWSVQSCDASITVLASVPGLVHTDLIDGKIIMEDPYFGFNELEQSWVSKHECWTYHTEVLLKNFSDEPVFLEIEGLDTIGKVYLNDNLVGSSSNAFIRNTFDVSNALLKDQLNKISVRIDSAIDYAKNMAASYPYSVPETVNYNVWAEPSSRNFIRKAGNDFGWDWGPAYVPSGITGGVSIYQTQIGKFSDMVLLQSINDDYSNVDLKAKLRFEGVSKLQDKLFVSLSINGVSQLASEYILSDGIVELDTVTINKPTLWYPVGMGDPYLYDVSVSVCPIQGKKAKSSCQSLSKRVGIRNIELVQDPIQESANTPLDHEYSYNKHNASFTETHESVGLYNVPPASFYFKVNDIPIFAKGANFIPIDSFSSRVTRDDR